jgi:hypothetical protein
LARVQEAPLALARRRQVPDRRRVATAGRRFCLNTCSAANLNHSTANDTGHRIPERARMSNSLLTPPTSRRPTRLRRSAVLAAALFGVAIVAASCSSTTSAKSAGSGHHAARTTVPSTTTPSTTTPSTTAPSTSGAPATSATGATGVAAVCADVRITQATVIRTHIVPADEAQKILADSQSSGNAKLESEASTLASASHVLDHAGTTAALAAMAITCHEVSPTP